MRVRFVIPARSNSVRVKNKNHKEFIHTPSGGKSLTDIACEDVEHMCKELGSGSNGVLISDVEGRRFYTNIYRFAYPKFLGGSKTAEEFEVDNSLQLWHLGLSVMNGPQDVTVLIEPSSYPRSTDTILTQIYELDKKTIVAVRIDHRYGMKAHVFVPTGEFYIADTKRVLDFTAFHGDMDYAFSKAMNINTQSDWDEARRIGI